MIMFFFDRIIHTNTAVLWLQVATDKDSSQVYKFVFQEKRPTCSHWLTYQFLSRELTRFSQKKEIF